MFCPTDAAACSVGMSVGRRLRPSAGNPAAMAPEDTNTTSTPDRRTAEICVTSDEICR
jgi:hypothetical protein